MGDQFRRVSVQHDPTRGLIKPQRNVFHVRRITLLFIDSLRSTGSSVTYDRDAIFATAQPADSSARRSQRGVKVAGGPAG